MVLTGTGMPRAPRLSSGQAQGRDPAAGASVGDAPIDVATIHQDPRRGFRGEQRLVHRQHRGKDVLPAARHCAWLGCTAVQGLGAIF